MINHSDELKSILAGSVHNRAKPRVESWYGDELLATDIPVATGSESPSRRQPERVTLTVPRYADGFDWAPGANDKHPLAANGQRLRIEIGYETNPGNVEYLQRGWFAVFNTEADADTVTVEARGLLSLVDEARLISPYQPVGFVSTNLRRLLAPTLPVLLDSSVTDKAIPAGVNFDDRLGAVYHVLDAVAADGWVTEDGTFFVTSALGQSSTPVLELVDGQNATVIRMAGSSTRDDAYNAYVARGTAADGSPVQAVEYDTSGPKGVQTPFNPMPVPYFYESPIITDRGMAGAAAKTIMLRKRRETNRAFDVTIPPHPALQVGDIVLVKADGITDVLCTVESMELPYTGQAAMRLTVRTVTAI